MQPVAVRMTSICGKCGGRIPAGREVCPVCAPSRKSVDAVPAFMVVALLCSSFLLVGTSFVNVQIAPATKPLGDLNLAAYNAARQFITEKSQSIESFSEYAQSGVEHAGRIFSVTIATDETGADSRPVRNFYRVEMEFGNDNWNLKSITQ